MNMTAIISSLLLVAATTHTPNRIRFTVEVEENVGQVHCAVYDSEDTWLSKTVVAGTTAKVRNRRAICVLDLAPGRYAISAFHDEDSDGKLDTNFLGIPSEDYAASRDARGTMGPPSFKDASFEFRGGVLELSVKAD